MSPVEIPLLRESAAFARRLVQAAYAFGEPRYHFHRRVNWSYRYSEVFYGNESALFQFDSDAYLQGRVPTAPQLDDVYTRALRGKQVLTVVAKVLAHTLFAWLGRGADQGLKHDRVGIYRKAYVDDIELVFEPAQASVVRAVYPFPINLGRQWRYLRFLRQQGHRFKLAGNPYGLGDFWRFLRRRDVRSLMRLESRAQVRHAQYVAALGVHTVQLSDEFDVGSLDFARTLARFPLQVVNSAHGVGKYFPVHAYPEFSVLTQRQAEYYYPTRTCRYLLRSLNVKSDMSSLGVFARVPNSERVGGSQPMLSLVFLSQVFVGISPLVREAEARVVHHLANALGRAENVRLLYKPHPNHRRPLPPKGFAFLERLEDVNGCAGTVFASFFSTCQIDPSFVGTKVLLRERLIHPSIAFDDTETVLDAPGLVALIDSLPFGAFSGSATTHEPSLAFAATPTADAWNDDRCKAADVSGNSSP
jgi:hypothetical protein